MPIQDSIQLVGILNVTPDSFSDGGAHFSVEDAVAHAEQLIVEGADIIDIGGDSTRPGSECSGPIEEWKRISAVLERMAPKLPVSVDTHHASVAAQAIEKGASYINDISAGSDPEMFSAVAGTAAKLILMHSRCPSPHCFEAAPAGDVVQLVKKFLCGRVEAALQAGLLEEQLILDPGMGGFISEDPAVSWELIRRYRELRTLDLPLMFASSRKGFLKQSGESEIAERDALSALTAYMVASQFEFAGPQYLRVHNVGLHRSFLNAGHIPRHYSFS